jgi:hypothetical protein
MKGNTMSTLTYTDSTGTIYWWSGGAYIDVGIPRGPAFDCINVYDYEAGKVKIPFNRKELIAHAKEWLSDNEQYLADYRMSVR